MVGPIINRHSNLKKRLKSISLRHGIPHIDLVRTYLGLLCQGKNDFEAVEGVRDDLFFPTGAGYYRQAGGGPGVDSRKETYTQDKSGG